MIKLPDVKIKHKLTAIIMLTCTIALSIVLVSFIAWEYYDAKAQMVSNYSTHIAIIADNSKAAIAFENKNDAKEILSSLHVKLSTVFACLYNEKGEPLAEYRRWDIPKITTKPELSEAGHIFKDDYLYILKQIELDNELIGSIYLKAELSEIYRGLLVDLVLGVIVTAGALFLAYFLSIKLQKIVSKPILNLTQIVKAVSEGGCYSTQVTKNSNDEVGLLTNAFNKMLEQIQQRDKTLVNTNEQLEAKVQKRTTELTKEITIRKKAEENIERSLSLLNATLESTADGILVVDTEGKVTSFNQKFVDMWRIPKRIMQSKDNDKLLDFVLSQLKDPKGFFKKAKPSYNQPQAETLDILKLKDGKVFRHYSQSQTIAGKTVGRVWSFHDITEAKKAEEALEALNDELANAVDQLTLANHELKDFAFIAAHDLKAPLRAIGTLAYWLATDYNDCFDEQGKEKVTLLVERAKRMSKHIDGILRYSEIGWKNNEKTKIDLNQLISEIIEYVGPQENIEIIIENKLPVLVSDKIRLVQIFQNLLSNAVKYIDKPQGSIRIGCVEENDFWKFSVADNGLGIEEKHFDKIFQIFQTLARRDDAESTGIGLSIVKKVIQLYGGKIWVESKVGKGSTFFFTLPKQNSKYIKTVKLQEEAIA